MSYSGTKVPVANMYILMPTLRLSYLHSYYYTLGHLLMLDIVLQYLRDVFILAGRYRALSVIMYY